MKRNLIKTRKAEQTLLSRAPFVAFALALLVLALLSQTGCQAGPGRDEIQTEDNTKEFIVRANGTYEKGGERLTIHSDGSLTWQKLNAQCPHTIRGQIDSLIAQVDNKIGKRSYILNYTQVSMEPAAEQFQILTKPTEVEDCNRGIKGGSTTLPQSFALVINFYDDSVIELIPSSETTDVQDYLQKNYIRLNRRENAMVRFRKERDVIINKVRLSDLEDQ
jgi:hypothetical protein